MRSSWSPFPFTDLTGRRVRPAVIVSPDPQGDDFLVTFISSVAPTRTAPTEWLVGTDHPEFPATGLKYPSVFKAGKLVTLHRSLILRRLGHLGPTLQTIIACWVNRDHLRLGHCRHLDDAGRMSQHNRRRPHG